MSNIIIIIKKKENTNTDIYDNTSHQECHGKGSRKEFKRKYKSLHTEVKGTWNMKCTRIIKLVITGATGIETNFLNKKKTQVQSTTVLSKM